MFFQHYSATPFCCSNETFYEILRIFSPSLILSCFSPWISSIRGWQIYLQVTDSSHPEPCNCLMVDGTPSFVHFSIVVRSPFRKDLDHLRTVEVTYSFSLSLSSLCGDVCHLPFTGTVHIPRLVFLWRFLRLFLSAKVLFHFARAVWLDTGSWVPTFFSAS